jgi:drug/metabolite transporter (DMT)-like permease
LLTSPPQTSGFIWLCLAPLFYAALSISAKLSGAHLSVWQISVGRFGLGLLILPVIVRVLGLSLWGQRRLLLSARGLCGAIAFLLLVAAFQRIPLSLAMVLFYLYPAFTAILSPWVTGEPTAKSAWPFICGAIIGTSLILWPFGESTTFNLGHIFSIISSFLCAMTVLLVRRLGRENNIYTLYFYLCLTGTLGGIGPLLMQAHPVLPTGTAAWIGIAAVSVFSIVAQLSINQALVRFPAPKVSVIMTVEVPLVASFGVIYLNEPLTWNFLVGTLLIFGSGTGLNLMPVRSK